MCLHLQKLLLTICISTLKGPPGDEEHKPEFHQLGIAGVAELTLKQSIVQFVVKLRVSEDYLCNLKLATQALNLPMIDHHELEGRGGEHRTQKDRGTIKEIKIMNMKEENCASIPFFLFCFILTSIQVRCSSKSSPLVQRDTFTSNGPETEIVHIHIEITNTTWAAMTHVGMIVLQLHPLGFFPMCDTNGDGWHV